jgi:hydrogenase maturation protease
VLVRRGLSTAVVGGVSQLYQGDWDFGRRVLEVLATANLAPTVALEHFDYGAVAVVQRLGELAPDLLILVGAAERGQPPGSMTRRVVQPLRLPRSVVGQAVAEAVTGYVTMDLLLEVASGLGALPARTVVIELEPARGGPCEELSPLAQAALDEAVALVRAELVPLQLSGSGTRSSTPSA